MLAISDYGKNIQEGISSVVNDGHFNNAAIGHLFDDKNKDVFKSPTSFSVTFKDANKFDVQNPVIGNLLSQVNANQLIDKQVKKILDEGEDLKIRARLDALRNNTDGNDVDEDGSDGGSGGGGSYRRKLKKKKTAEIITASYGITSITTNCLDNKFKAANSSTSFNIKTINKTKK